MRTLRPIAISGMGLGVILMLAACSDPKPPADPVATQAAGAPATPPPSPAEPVATVQVADNGPLAVPPVAAPDDPAAKPINDASLPVGKAPTEAKRAALTRAEVLLARAHFSPGVIDGRDGGNLQAALSSFQAAHGLPVDGKLTPQVWEALTEADPAPVIVRYTITADDVKGPFLDTLPTDFTELAKLDHLGFTSPLEALGEKFHMDEGLLKRLNPNADFATAGTTILVAAPGPETLPAQVVAIEVDKTARQVRAYGADGALIASYPATVGSTERPAPSGVFAVKGNAPNPTYTYDPKRLTFGDKTMGKLTIKPGPNNPVGVDWIDLTIPTYGIHGAPDPRLVGKVASHGCVRLTNWDVRQLASAVKRGAKVTFLGVERAPGETAKPSSASAG